MFANDPLHRGQSDARAFEVLGPMQTLKDAKQLVFVLHAEADAIVANEDDALAIFLEMTDLNDGALPRTRELKSIGDEVLKNLLDEDGIALDRRQLRNLPLHLPAFGVRLQQGDDLLNDRIQLGSVKVNGVAANARQIQKFIDEPAHAMNPVFDALQMMAGFRRHGCAKILGQHAGKAANVAQRRAQVMRYGVGESLEFLVCFLQLRGAS